MIRGWDERNKNKMRKKRLVLLPMKTSAWTFTSSSSSSSKSSSSPSSFLRVSSSFPLESRTGFIPGKKSTEDQSRVVAKCKFHSWRKPRVFNTFTLCFIYSFPDVRITWRSSWIQSTSCGTESSGRVESAWKINSPDSVICFSDEVTC